MIDAVLSYHMNPQTCGVAKFNHALAKRLGVPCLWIDSDEAARFSCPLLSVKWSEMPAPGPVSGSPWARFAVLLHDKPQTAREHEWMARAERVWFADRVGCPSTVEGDATRGAYRVLVFGMAHKLSLPHFEALKQELEIAHPDYTIELSTAVHEGNPWEKSLEESVAAMRALFGSRLRVLGFLGDDALAKELREVDAVAAYYVPALRANNTSYWAAVEAGKKVYTNRDEFSPKEGDPPVTWDALVALLKGAA